MHFARTLGTTALLIATATFPAAAQVEPLADPIPDPIRKGDLVVAATPFVRAPRTADSAVDAMTNEAYARIQYLTPVGDGSGRLVLNDLRGLLYITDENGAEPITYMDIRTLDVGFDDSMFPNETGLVGGGVPPAVRRRRHARVRQVLHGVQRKVGQRDRRLPGRRRGEPRERDPRVDGRRSGGERVQRHVARGLPASASSPPTTTSAPSRSIRTRPRDRRSTGCSMRASGTPERPTIPATSASPSPHPTARSSASTPSAATATGGYGIPADNPFVGEAGVAPEIWAYGLRHAQQFSWDTDGRMFMGDIGQNVVEEVNLGVPGANYGWRLREGTFGTGYTLTPRRPGPAYPPPAEDDHPFVYPVAQYDHDEGYAVSGGFVYRGEAIPELQGKYVFTDFPRGRVFYIDADALVPGELAEIRELRLVIDGEERDLVEAAGIPNTYAPGDRADARLGIDSTGELYLLTKSDGWVRKLEPAGAR